MIVSTSPVQEYNRRNVSTVTFAIYLLAHTINEIINETKSKLRDEVLMENRRFTNLIQVVSINYNLISATDNSTNIGMR